MTAIKIISLASVVVSQVFYVKYVILNRHPVEIISIQNDSPPPSVVVSNAMVKMQSAVEKSLESVKNAEEVAKESQEVAKKALVQRDEWMEDYKKLRNQTIRLLEEVNSCTNYSHHFPTIEQKGSK